MEKSADYKKDPETVPPTKIQAPQMTYGNYREHERVRLHFAEPSMAKQSFAAECDINTIMKKYEKTGLIDHRARYPGGYADVFNVGEYQEGLNQIRAAQEAFASLPAKVRRRFDNDPGAFVAFVENPENLEVLREMGLALPKEPTEPLPAEPSLPLGGPAPTPATMPPVLAEGAP